MKTSEKSRSQGSVLGLTASGAGGAGVPATPMALPATTPGNSSGGEATMSEGGYETTITLTILQSYDGDAQSTKRVETKKTSRAFTADVTVSRVEGVLRAC